MNLPGSNKRDRALAVLETLLAGVFVFLVLLAFANDNFQALKTIFIMMLVLSVVTLWLIPMALKLMPKGILGTAFGCLFGILTLLVGGFVAVKIAKFLFQMLEWAWNA